MGLTFMGRYTPAQYRLRGLHITREPDGEGGLDVTATFEMELMNSEGRGLTHSNYTITLTSGEVDTLRNFVAAKLAVFETETGLTRYTQTPRMSKDDE